MRLEWSPRALADLNRFVEFLGERYPSLAKIVSTEIARRAALLEEHPQLGQPVPGRERFRKIVVTAVGASYVLEYRTLGERVIVVRVFHAREHRPIE